MSYFPQMVYGGKRARPLQLVFNFWEFAPSRLFSELDACKASGFEELTAFIPWQGFENDITHKFHKFLTAAIERKITLNLIVTPELGMQFPFSGIPKEIANKKENLAISQGGLTFPNFFPPQASFLVSLTSPEVQSRYLNFISKLFGFLSEFCKQQKHASRFIHIQISGSFWKYYRHPLEESEPFQVSSQDDSPSSKNEYQKFLEQKKNLGHFFDKKPTHEKSLRNTAEIWTKSAHVSECEQNFREKVRACFSKGDRFSVAQTDLFCPEADPTFSFSNFLGEKKETVFKRLSDLAFSYLERKSFFKERPVSSFIYFTGTGAFLELSRAEKQLLSLRSLVSAGSDHGGVCFDWEVWKDFSKAFRERLFLISDEIEEGSLTQGIKTQIWVSNLWAKPSLFSNLLLKDKRFSGSLVNANREFSHRLDSELMVIDDSVALNEGALEPLFKNLRRGQIIVLFRGMRLSQGASRLIEEKTTGWKRFHLEHGARFELRSGKKGSLLMVNENSRNTSVEPMRDLAHALFLLSQDRLKSDFTVSGGSVFEAKSEEGDAVLFLMNETAAATKIKVQMDADYVLGDYFSKVKKLASAEEMEMGREMEFDIPAFGMIAIATKHKEVTHGASVRLEEL